MFYEIIILFIKDSFNPNKNFLSSFYSKIGKENILKKKLVKNVKLSYFIKNRNIADFFFIFTKKITNIKKELDKKLKFKDEVLRYIIIKINEKEFKEYCKNDKTK